MKAVRMRNIDLALAFALALASGGFACDRTPEPKPHTSPKRAAAAASPEAKAPVSAAPAASSGGSENFRLQTRKRVVAIGDVHGDLGALREALRLAGAIDSDDRWVGCEPASPESIAQHQHVIRARLILLSDKHTS